jgi:hypothetical protein
MQEPEKKSHHLSGKPWSKVRWEAFRRTKEHLAKLNAESDEDNVEPGK